MSFDSPRRSELANLYRDGLLEDVLPFWLRHGVDDEFGGIMTAIDHDGRIVDTDKGIWQQGRFVWLLGKLYNSVERNEDWLTLARHGGDFLQQHGFDPDDGRMWFHVTREGQPIRKRRYAFSESFAAIAFGELALATGEKHSAQLATRCFERFIDQNVNPAPADRKFTSTRPARGIGFPMITIATAQELRDSISLPTANLWIDRSIEEIRRHFLKPDIECVMETVGPEGELIDHFDGRTLNPGHAIEGAWFIMREGQTRHDRELIDVGCRMLDWMWRRGWDRDQGGLRYFVDVRGLPVQEYWHELKFWWPHNEAVIATLLAFELTGDPKYARWHRDVHDWSHQHFPDPVHGEWFGYLRHDGSRSSTLKGNLWKGPFHLPRMQLTCWNLLTRNHC